MAAYPDAPRPWLDLSTGIAPWPYPISPPAVESWQRLPDPSALATLCAAARAPYGASAEAAIVALPGTDLAINALPRLVAPGRRVSIVSPTYGSHAEAWHRCGHRISCVEDPGNIADCDIGVLVNPNNPDGRSWSPDAVVAAADRLAPSGAWLLVDEAFADVMPDVSVAGQTTAHPNLVVLRSFGKFFGLAGMRLGFAITAHAVGRHLGQLAGDWPVSGPAIETGTAALRDTAWQQRQRARLTSAAAALDLTLQAGGLDVVGRTPLFALAASPDALALFHRLCEAGILVRPFAGRDVLRFGIPGSAGDLDRLARALALNR